MNATQDQIQILKGNLERLLRSYQAIKSENDILKNQVEAQRKGMSDKNKRIEDLEKQVELIKTAQTITHHESGEESASEKSEMKKQINQLIKEVDNCIATLNE